VVLTVAGFQKTANVTKKISVHTSIKTEAKIPSCQQSDDKIFNWIF
jgi:hypothetical protein